MIRALFLIIVLIIYLRGHILTIKETLSIYPATICHGDYRLDNIFFKNDELVVFDWEYCVRGRGVYDVATFITEAFNPIERKRWECDLLKLYCSTLQENGISDYSFDDCFYDYSVSMLEIFVFWVVTGGYCDYNTERSMAYLKTSMIRFDAAIADLDSLQSDVYMASSAALAKTEIHKTCSGVGGSLDSVASYFCWNFAI